MIKSLVRSVLGVYLGTWGRFEVDLWVDSIINKTNK